MRPKQALLKMLCVGSHCRQYRLAHNALEKRVCLVEVVHVVSTVFVMVVNVGFEEEVGCVGVSGISS